MGQVRWKIEGIAGAQQVDFTIDGKLKLTFHHVTHLFALMLKDACRMPTWLDYDNEAFEQPPFRMWDDDLRLDAFAAGA